MAYILSEILNWLTFLEAMQENKRVPFIFVHFMMTYTVFLSRCDDVTVYRGNEHQASTIINDVTAVKK